MTESLLVARDLVLVLLLAASVVTDLRSRRILNAFTYPALVFGAAVAMTRGPAAFGDAFAGALLGAVVLWPLCRSGGMGWGDLKLAAASGSLTGLPTAGAALVGGALAGGLAAVVLVLIRGDFLITLRRSLAVPRGVFRSLRRGGRPAFVARRGTTLPYGVAIAVGTAVARWVHWPW